MVKGERTKGGSCDLWEGCSGRGYGFIDLLLSIYSQRCIKFNRLLNYIISNILSDILQLI